MTSLRLSIAVGDYDRNRPIYDGRARIDGVDPIVMLLSPEEMFYRAFRHQEFDVCELSLSSFALKTAHDDNPYVGIPVFPSRAFRHTGIVIRSDCGVREPSDLRGRRIGTPEYQLTACVWIRAILKDDYGVEPNQITWVRGGMERPGRIEKIALDLADIKFEPAPENTTLTQLIETGKIDGIIGPRLPSCFHKTNSNVKWLFEDPTQAASDYYQRTGIFPIMHILGIRKNLVQQHPWLPNALYKSFEQAKEMALDSLIDTSATKVTLPFVEEQLHKTRQLMGEDFWSYGLESNRHTLDTFLHHHHDQGLSPRRVQVDELFAPSTLDRHVI